MIKETAGGGTCAALRIAAVQLMLLKCSPEAGTA